MKTTQTTQTKIRSHGITLYPLLLPKERLALLESVRGMWKHRTPDPILELKKMRRQSDRKLPSLR